MEKGFFASISLSGPTRLRLAAVLLAMFCAIIVGKLVEDSLIARLQHDCESLFDDRLVPATALFHLGDQMHLKHRLLDDYLENPPAIDSQKLHYAMGQHDARLAGLIERIEQTYLVEEESQLFHAFQKSLADYQKVEQILIDEEKGGEDAVNRAALAKSFAEVRQTMLKLTDVQQRVGSELRAESITAASNVTLLLYFQLGIAFILGLISSALAMGVSRPRDPPSGPASGEDQNLH
ncbi:MAG: MCP four helix bundle domain-containing protein [Myxococcales bacterium]|nr:MCP four helix bundle domain-containing protein [Myxococcales bacterium]